MTHKLALILWKCFSLNILSSFNRLQAASWQHSQATLKKQYIFLLFIARCRAAEREKKRKTAL